MEPTTAPRNPFTWKPGTMAVTSHRSSPLITRRKSPERHHRDGKGQQHEEGPDDRVHQPEDEGGGQRRHHPVDGDDLRQQVPDQKDRDRVGDHPDEE